MISLIYYGMIAACILVLTGLLYRTIVRMEEKSVREKSLSMEEYLFKISRITGHREAVVYFARPEIRINCQPFVVIPALRVKIIGHPLTSFRFGSI